MSTVIAAIIGVGIGLIIGVDGCTSQASAGIQHGDGEEYSKPTPPENNIRD